MGRPFVAPPEIPKSRAEALRSAFDQTMKDPEFLADADQRKIEINPVSGAAINSLMIELYKYPPEILAQARRAAEASQ